MGNTIDSLDWLGSKLIIEPSLKDLSISKLMLENSFLKIENDFSITEVLSFESHRIYYDCFNGKDSAFSFLLSDKEISYIDLQYNFLIHLIDFYKSYYYRKLKNFDAIYKKYSDKLIYI